MNPIQNIHFTLLIRVNNRLHEFNFRRRQDDSFDADTSDDRGNRHYFKILVSGSKWNMMGANLPRWITENEAVIIEKLQEKVGE
jgi:hypothetical protein